MPRALEEATLEPHRHLRSAERREVLVAEHRDVHALLRQGLAAVQRLEGLECARDVVHDDPVERGLLHPHPLFRGRRENVREPRRERIDVARLEEVAVLAVVDEVGRATALAATIGRPEAIASIVAIDCSSATEAIAKTLARE